MNEMHDEEQHRLQHQLEPDYDPHEIHRLRLLLDAANRQKRDVESVRNDSQVESAKGRVDFYDRLTIGSGATIAALVSFLGTHSEKLQPRWILRSALISLVLTMLASLFRNYRYPNYVLQIHKISWINCCRYEQQCRLNLIRAEPGTVSIRTGQPIDSDTVTESIGKSDQEIEALLKECLEASEHLRKQWTYAQFASIGFAALAMIFLVWLAIANF